MEKYSESKHLLDEGKDNEASPLDKEQDLNQKEGKKSFWDDTTRKQKFSVAFAAAGTSSIYFCQSVPGTFLARVILAQGGDKVYAAAILNSSYLISSVASLICGKYQSRIPTKKFIWIGLLIVALSQACLGFLAYFEGISFLMFGIVVKAFQGVGQGFFTVALLTLLWHELPEYVGRAFGLIGSTASIGFLIGPITGGSLYSIQNSVMIPFLVSALVPLLMSVLGMAFLPNVGGKSEKSSYRTWYYILNPRSVIALGLAATCSAAFAVYDASFTTYAQTMNISVIVVGWIMSVGDGCVAIACIILGYFSDINPKARKTVIAISLLSLFGINFAFLSHLPLVLLFVVVIAFGVFAVAVQNMGFLETIHQAVGDNEELKSDFSFRSKLTGVWYFIMTSSMVCLGIMGTQIQSYLPYYMSLIITLLVGLTVTFISSFMIYLYRLVSGAE